MNIYKKDQLHDYAPKIIRKNRFSRKPNYLKHLFWWIVIIGAILVLGDFVLKANDTSNKALCNEWLRDGQVLRTRSYQQVFTVEDIHFCEFYGIELNK